MFWQNACKIHQSGNCWSKIHASLRGVVAEIFANKCPSLPLSWKGNSSTYHFIFNPDTWQSLGCLDWSPFDSGMGISVSKCWFAERYYVVPRFIEGKKHLQKQTNTRENHGVRFSARQAPTRLPPSCSKIMGMQDRKRSGRTSPNLVGSVGCMMLYVPVSPQNNEMCTLYLDDML